MGEFAEIARLGIEGNSLAIGYPLTAYGPKAFGERGILAGELASAAHPTGGSEEKVMAKM